MPPTVGVRNLTSMPASVPSRHFMLTPHCSCHGKPLSGRTRTTSNDRYVDLVERRAECRQRGKRASRRCGSNGSAFVLALIIIVGGIGIAVVSEIRFGISHQISPF